MRITPTFAALVTSIPLLAGAPAGASQVSQPTGTPVVRISSEGGFVAPGFIKTALPSLVAYANGTALTNDVPETRPDLRSMRLHIVRQDRMRALAKVVAQAAVTPKGGWGTPGVADVPNTHIVIAYPGLRRDVSVYALSFTTGGNVTPAQATARKALRRALEALTAYVAKAPRATWRPARYEAWTFAELFVSQGVGMPNPASLFCQSMGGALNISDTTGGQVGYCTLPDGSKQEEWAYFRASAPTLAHWPANVAAPAKACTVVAEPAFRSALRGPNPTGRWLLPSGQAPTFVFRPVLPGEQACQRG